MAENKERKGNDLNTIIFTGRMAGDPELKTLTNEKHTEVCNFVVANQTYGAKQASFINCQAFAHTAKFVGEFLKKGNQVTVEGELSIHPYEDKKGIKRNYTVVNVRNILSSFATTKPSQNDSTPIEEIGEEIDEDEDLPF